jgi:hypothetical protein
MSLIKETRTYLFKSLFTEQPEIVEALSKVTGEYSDERFQAVYKFAAAQRVELIKLYADGKTIEDAEIHVTTMGGQPVQSTASFARTEEILKERYKK